MAEPDLTVSVDTSTEPTPTPAGEPQDDGLLKDTGEGIATGFTKGANEISQTADSATGGYLSAATDWLGANVVDLGSLGVDEKGTLQYYRAADAIQEAKAAGLKRGDPEFDAFVSKRVSTTKLTDGLQTMSGNLASGLTQFAVGWMPANRLLKPLQVDTKRGKAVKLAGEGAIAELIAFDKHDERISNMMQDHPSLANPLAEFLAADPDDPVPLAIFKQAAEGMITEAAMVTVVAGLKAVRASNRNLAETEQLVKEAEEEATVLAKELNLGAEVENEIASVAATSEVLNAAYKASESLSGSARTKKRLKGRKDSMDEMTPEALADLNAQGGGVALTREAMQEEAKADIIRHLRPYGGDVTKGVEQWLARHNGDFVKARKLLSSADELRKVSNVQFAKSSEQFRLAVQNGAPEAEVAALRTTAVQDFKNTLRLVNVLKGGFSEAGRMLDFAKSVDGWNVNTIDAALDAGSAFAPDSAASKSLYGQLAQHSYSLQKAGAAGVRIVNELFINSILSGVKTHLVNIGSNTFTTATMPLERLMGAGIRGDKKEMMKALHTYQGMAQHSWSSLKASVQAAKKGQTILDVDRSYLEEGMTTGSIPTIIGVLIRMPTRLLAAEDEFFKQLNFRSYAFAEAMADGAALGYKGVELKDYVKNQVDTAVTDQIQSNVDGILTNPVAIKGIEAGRKTTFTQDTAGKSVNERMSNSYTKLVNEFPLLRQISPFIRTPLNIASYVLQRSPLAPLSGRWRRDMAVDGSQEQAEALVRFGIGSSLASYFYSLAQQGGLTGTGSELSSNQVKAMEDMYGYKRNSYYNGEEYKEISRLSPVSDLALIMASIYEINKYGAKKEADELAAAVAITLSEVARDKTFMQGVTDFINAVDDPERFGTSYVGNRIGALVPYSGLMKSLNGDPNLRKIYELAEAYKKNIPGLSRDLDPQRNLLGEVKLIPEFWGIDSASPIGLSVEKDDPIALAFKQAADNGTPFDIGLPSTTVDTLDWTNRDWSTDRNGKPLNPNRVKQTAYDRWIEISGAMSLDVFGNGTNLTLREALTSIIEDPRFQGEATSNLKLGDRVYTGSRSDHINTMISEYRKIAKKVMVGNDPYEVGATSGVFSEDGFLLEVKGAANDKLAVAHWTQKKISEDLVKTQEGQNFIKENEQEANKRLNGVFFQGEN
tara:strand:- start:1014 stop:4517 length:3504 start_codon:yes stop_codon:yes gene_type:complete